MYNFQESWNELKDFLHQWYYQPDIEGLYVILCTYITHFYYSSPPVWLCIIGLPGSGKTEIGIRPLNSLGAISVSELTTNSFLSGYGQGNGLLDQFNPIDALSERTQGILTFPDFTTTLLSKDPMTRAEIMGQMRRVYDGALEKRVGNRAEMLTWEGKATCIAAATPDIEEHWAIHRDMGERWLNIKWGNLNPSMEDMFQIQECAERHEGNEEKIQKGLEKRIKKIIDNVGNGPQGNPSSRQIAAIGILLEECRTNVKREFTGRGYHVTGQGNKQMNTRISKCLSLLCKASAALRNSDKFEEMDYNVARRVALDSVPLKRWKLIRIMAQLHPTPIGIRELIQATGFTRSTFNRIVEDLRYLGVIKVIEDRSDGMGLDDVVINQDDEEDSSIPYNFKTPRGNSIFSLSPHILTLLKESGLDNTINAAT